MAVLEVQFTFNAPHDRVKFIFTQLVGEDGISTVLREGRVMRVSTGSEVVWEREGAYWYRARPTGNFFTSLWCSGSSLL
jgi:hypothetical protein